MSFFTICGHMNCQEFIHAVFVAHYLHEHLPNFQYEKVEKSFGQWTKLVEELNQKNKWSNSTSPIIYKQISTWGGKKYLIGGLSEFWEYVYCYYGLESLIAKCDLLKLVEDNIQFHKDKQRFIPKKEPKVISIMGASDRITYALLNEIIRIPSLTEENITVKLHDRGDPERKSEHYLDDIVEYYKSMCLTKVVVVEEFERHAIKDCDILIHVEDFSKRTSEDQDRWLHRCLLRMTYLADWINLYAKRSLKLILANNGPVCYLGSLLVEFCTMLTADNIVAVTANEGLSTLNVVSDMLKMHVCDMSAPPVWGFIGLNQFVDEEHIIYKAKVYRPFERAIMAPPDSTLPAGTVKTELRILCHKVSGLHEQIAEEVENRRMLMEVRLKHKPCLAKLRAIISLMNLWFGTTGEDTVISLGVWSDGSFNIPAGLMYSQPVALNEKQKWRPVQNFPLINDNGRKKVSELAEEAMQILSKHLNEGMEYPEGVNEVSLLLGQ